MELIEIEDKKRELEYQQGKIKKKLKTLTAHHHSALVEECVEQLLREWQTKGELDRFDIRTYLQELTTQIRGLYDK